MPVTSPDATPRIAKCNVESIDASCLLKLRIEMRLNGLVNRRFIRSKTTRAHDCCLAECDLASNWNTSALT